ncbi:MAG: amino acid ABC transporter permease [Candidatus Dadabacteria bacterium]|nr:MAG: amino acid ABC transporter permease [Candidatus Dadabacteria bacterium]
MARPADAPAGAPRFWNDPAFRSLAFQAAVLAVVLAVGYYLFQNVQANLARQNIATGFGFLGREAGFEIGESPIPYSAADTYLKALWVGVLNTLRVSFIGIVLTVILGTFVGIARLSSNWLVSRLAGGYIEALQDVPVLLQLFFWYALFNEILPSPRQALHPLPGVYLCNRGLLLPVPEGHPAYRWAAVAFLVACLLVWAIRRWARRRQEATGKIFPTFRVGLGLLVGLPVLGWWLGGAPTAVSVPVLKGFNFRGGLALSPEFAALLLGLVLYTSAFVAEIVRAGIQSVSHGQTEAAMSLGLTPGQTLNLVILPQALRVIVPPLTSQMLNLTKNSSLAVAIGFPDFVSVANTTINQTGQAIEGVVLIMVVYLMFSLSTSAFMNWYNKRIALVER